NITGGFRGHNLSSYCAGVVSSGHNNHYYDLNVFGFVAGVFLHAHNVDGAEGFSENSKNNTVEKIEVDSVDFGVLMSRYDDFKILDIS
ncbi:hypothetical protein R0J90_17650, partial [Micrococcus sp. SIMBA_144]